MKHQYLKSLKSNKGTSIVIFAIALTAISICSSLTIDMGMVFIEKSELSSTVDAASLAGAQELVINSSNASNIVNAYISKNIGTLEKIDISIDNSSRTIELTGTKEVKSFFSKVLGKSYLNITSTAKAKVENIKSVKGARPLAIVQQTFVYGSLYTLKEGGGDGTSGNYAAIALGGSGASNYSANMIEGYGGTLSVGDLIETETGNISGATETSINYLMGACNHTPQCTYQNYNKSCSKIIYVPVVNTLDVNGRKYVQILGFATFFLEGTTSESGQADVLGRFITYSMQGETSSDINDYGTYGIKLIK